MHHSEDIWGLFDLVGRASTDIGRARFDRILEHVVRVFEADGGSLFLREAGGDHHPLVSKAGDLSKMPWTAEIVPGEGIAGTAIMECQPLLIGDPSQESLLKSSITRRKEIATSLVLPLEGRANDVLGVLCLSRRASHQPFTADDLQKGKSLAGYLALAVANAQMMRDLQDMERMKRMAEIGQMTASIAHEIRNPLTGIRSAAQMVRSNPELADEFGEIIESEARRLNGLCDDFLAFAKPLALHPAPTDLGVLVRLVCGLLQPQFDQARIALVVRAPEKPVRREVDESRIKQVLSNLVLNALQASQAGSRVTVALSSGGTITVEDEGVGMDAETVGRLFSAFFTTKPSGTGLGLSMVQKIVEAHGGEVKVTSEPRVGSRFEIVFSERNAA
ncbi:MAG: GAF domain-containing protein [Chthonomonas sp.]|nr:GAF domain-containing protein [Chthonomonas sp.]